jgi:hypothetical protein
VPDVKNGYVSPPKRAAGARKAFKRGKGGAAPQGGLRARLALGKGGKGGGASYSPPAPAAAMAQNVSTEGDAGAEVSRLASDAKKKGYWWTKTQNRDGGQGLGKGLVGQ